MLQSLSPLEFGIQLFYTQLNSLNARIDIRLKIIHMFLTPIAARSLIMVNNVIDMLITKSTVLIVQNVEEHSRRYCLTASAIFQKI